MSYELLFLPIILDKGQIITLMLIVVKRCILLVTDMNLVVYLAVDTKDDTALAAYEAFIQHCHKHEHSEHLEIRIITPEQLVSEKATSENREISLAKALDKLIHTKKVEKTKGKKEESHHHHHHHQVARIFILQNYPTTEDEMIALMDSKFTYPILDAVIKIVNRTDATLIRYILFFLHILIF